MSKLTILTPTYNRAGTLPKLYESLRKQSQKDFEWLVIDDGSKDGTEELVRGWKEEGEVFITYIYQENGGKHTALNRGIGQIASELTFIVDSDDWLPEDSVEIVLRYHEKYRDVEGLCGYSFLRFYSNGQVNEAFFRKDEQIDTYINVRINGGIGGDKAEVFYTDVLKKYPFPVFEGEKFVPEDLIWIQMSGPYKMVHINQCVYISDYLEGGLTRSGKRMKIKSPKAMTKRAELYLNSSAFNWKTRCKMVLLYIIYGHFAKQSYGELRMNLCETAKVLLDVFYVPGLLIYQVWSKKYI